jgi:hypothetical protein
VDFGTLLSHKPVFDELSVRDHHDDHEQPRGA